MEWYTIASCEEHGEYTELGSKDMGNDRTEALINIGLFIEEHKHCDVFVTESHDTYEALGYHIDWKRFKDAKSK